MDAQNQTVEVLTAIEAHIVTSQRKIDPISTFALQRFHVVMTGFWIIIAVTGVGTNFINLRTFLRIGLEDSVTISFFALTISDFNVCSIASIEMIGFLTIVLETELQLWFYIQPTIPTYFMMCVRRIFNTTTVIITTFLALQRCICVVFPFKVRGIFTRSRACITMASIFCFSVISYSLYIWRHQVREVTNPARNATQLSLFVIPGGEAIFFLIEVLLGIGLNISCQIIVLLCCIVMAVALRKAAKFRKSATISSDAKDIRRSANDSKAAQEKTNSKEIQALTQVTFLSVIFVATNSPYLFYGAANLLIPEFGLYQDFHNLYHLVHNLMFTAELLSSCINLVVYYKYNTKFRNHCFKHNKKSIIA